MYLVIRIVGVDFDNLFRNFRTEQHLSNLKFDRDNNFFSRFHKFTLYPSTGTSLRKTQYDVFSFTPSGVTRNLY